MALLLLGRVRLLVLHRLLLGIALLGVALGSVALGRRTTVTLGGRRRAVALRRVATAVRDALAGSWREKRGSECEWRMGVTYPWGYCDMVSMVSVRTVLVVWFVLDFLC